jgi:hypothetical protein
MTESNSALYGQAGVNASNVTLPDQAKQVARDLKEKASAVADSVTDIAKHEAEEIGTAAKEILADTTDRMKSAVTEQKTAGADYIDTVALAIQRAAGEFEADVPQAAQYIRRAGSQLGSVANAVRHRDMRELVTEVEDLARRQPALFFGGAVIVGFAALRFLKSSPPKTVQAKAPLG